MEIIMANNKKP